ncbi:hypothetical protein NBRC116583_38460 [Arenicella sp. 4NH20-0111]
MLRLNQSVWDGKNWHGCGTKGHKALIHATGGKVSWFSRVLVVKESWILVDTRFAYLTMAKNYI